MTKQLVLFRFPGVTVKQYDQIWNDLREAGIDHPSGLLHHVGAQSGDSLVVADVWESLEVFNKFGPTLAPFFVKAGFPQVKPEIAPVHYELYGVVEA